MTNHSTLFDSVLENSINTGIKNKLSKAISDSGVTVPSNVGLWEYPELIRKNLISKTVTGININAKDIINIDTSVNNDIITYTISTCIDTDKINHPKYANKNDKWGENMSAEDVFTDLFNNILPAVKGVHAGDMSITDDKGVDTKEWNNTFFNRTGVKSELEPKTRYIRLYLTCQAEPIYISFGDIIKDMDYKYNIISSDTVEIIKDDKNNSISANIKIINDSQLKELGII